MVEVRVSPPSSRPVSRARTERTDGPAGRMPLLSSRPWPLHAPISMAIPIREPSKGRRRGRSAIAIIVLESEPGQSARCDLLADRERRGRRGRRRVEHVHHAFGLDDGEVVDEHSVAVEGLRTDSGTPRGEILRRDLGHERRAGTGERGLAPRPPLLREPPPPVTPRHPPETRPARDGPRAAGVEPHAARAPPA